MAANGTSGARAAITSRPDLIPTFSIPELVRGKSAAARILMAWGWLAVVLLFASLWYAYDAGHSVADPLIDYIGWSGYLWGVLTPFALWFAYREPIGWSTWKRAVPLHIAASVMLTAVQLSLEASLHWLRAGNQWPLTAALRHYLSQHLQIGILSYWTIVGAVQFYRLHGEARARQLQAAQLEARLSDAQLELLRMQLQPHFLFNTLQAVATLVYDDPAAAEDVVLHLSELLRFSVDKLRVQEIPLRRELELLEHYTSIEQQRFGPRLRFDLQIDARVLGLAVPTLILQPLAENAVRHGVSKHKGDDVVSIRAFETEGQLWLEISNRTGVLEESPEKLFSRGVGLSNTRQRLEQLYGTRQTFEIFGLEPAGVTVRLSIPSHPTAEADRTPETVAVA